MWRLRRRTFSIRIYILDFQLETQSTASSFRNLDVAVGNQHKIICGYLPYFTFMLTGLTPVDRSVQGYF